MIECPGPPPSELQRNEGAATRRGGEEAGLKPRRQQREWKKALICTFSPTAGIELRAASNLIILALPCFETALSVLDPYQIQGWM
jgi:hypothetical protein